MNAASLHKTRFVGAIRQFRPLVAVIKECQRYLGLLSRPYAISRYLRTHAVRKLQIGAHVCALPGWLNTDLYPQTLDSVTLDATKRFPFGDASFHYVFSEHQLEHIGYKEALAMLAECHRILLSGGKIRIALPSLDRMIELLAPSRTGTQEEYIRSRTETCYPGARPSPCFAINAAFMNWGHKFLYDRETLSIALRDAGFTDVRFLAPSQSDDANLMGIEARVSEMDLYETMVIQATRP